MTLGFNSTLPCDSHRGTRSRTPHTPTCAPKFFSQKAQNAKPPAAITCILNHLAVVVSASRLFSHSCELRSGYVSYFHILAKKDRGGGVLTFWPTAPGARATYVGHATGTNERTHACPRKNSPQRAAPVSLLTAKRAIEGSNPFTVISFNMNRKNKPTKERAITCRLI
jgi:hypothetical protein